MDGIMMRLFNKKQVKPFKTHGTKNSDETKFDMAYTITVGHSQFSNKSRKK